MDQQKLRNLVFEKTGVRIDVDDPVFALVALNEAVLAEAVERHVALLDAATGILAEEVEAAPLRGPAGAVAPASSHRRAGKRMMAMAAASALLGALLVLFGQAIWFSPPTPAAPQSRPGALSAAQAGAIRDGEKLARIVRQLDPKTRARIQAALQQP
jgi:hypothetical protein